MLIIYNALLFCQGLTDPKEITDANIWMYCRRFFYHGDLVSFET